MRRTSRAAEREAYRVATLARTAPPRVAFTLRAYQRTAVNAVRSAWLAGRRRILLVMPTGGGKTKTAVSIVEAARAKGRGILWLTHRIELVKQASEALHALGVEHGTIGAKGHGRRRPDLPMQVASVQTLAKNPADLPRGINVIVIDEAHHVTAATWRAIVEAYPGLELVLGLTATPQRGDGTPLGDVFDGLVVATSVAELVAEGSLVPCRILAPKEAVSKLSEDPVAAYLRAGEGRRTIVFASNVPESTRLAAAFRAAGVPAEAVDGKTHPEARAAALRHLAEGSTRVVVNCFVLTEGADIPAVECIMIARGCTTDAAWMQSIGRGLRPSAATGKRDCLVIDLRGAFHEHGFPADARVFSLDGKGSQLASDEIEPLPACTCCPSCLAWGRGGGTCSFCGAERPAPPRPKVSQRSLVEMKQADAMKRAAAKNSERFAFFCDCVRRARDGLYKKAWPAMAYKRRYGMWPPSWTVGGVLELLKLSDWVPVDRTKSNGARAAAGAAVSP